MCGISGVLQLNGSVGTDLEQTARMMARQLHHRGPDRLGSWMAPDGQIAFGHTRLAVVDVSSAGDQPMTSFDGRWTIKDTTYERIYEINRQVDGDLGLASHYLGVHGAAVPAV